VEQFDIAIAGAGPAGAAAAIVLAKLGHSVALANLRAPNRFAVGEALAPRSLSLLDELGVRAQFEAELHRASYGTASAWGSSELQMTDHILQVAGNGYQLAREKFDAMLVRAAAEAGAKVFDNTWVSHAGIFDGGHQVHMHGELAGWEMSCQWLVDAGGRSGTLARDLGAVRQRLDKLIAVSMPLKTVETTDQDGRSWVEAVEDGWWYSALLPSALRLVIFLFDADITERSRLLTADGLLKRLQQTEHLSKLMAEHRYVPWMRPQGSDACTSRLTRFAGERWVAVGDAAISLDPLSSMGISNAMHLGIRAARAIHTAIDGEQHSLSSYEEHVGKIFAAYLANWRATYAMEGRWPNAPFWLRRG